MNTDLSFLFRKKTSDTSRLRLAAFALPLLVTLASCGGNGSDEEPASNEVPPASTSPDQPVTTPVPDTPSTEEPTPESPPVEEPAPVTLTPVFTSVTSAPFPSNLFSVIALKDETYAFASVSDATIDSVTTSPGAVVAVLKKEGDEWKVLHYIAVNSANKTGLRAFGLALSPDESVLAVALNNKGIGLLDVKAAINGDAIPTYVGLYTGYTKSGSGAGSIAIVAASDNKHFFVADEYGESSGASGIGDVAVVSYARGSDGAITGQRLGYVKTGQNSIASLNISPDGKTLYIPSQVASQAVYASFSGISNPAIGKQCGTSYSGSISVVDVDRLIALADDNPGTGNRVLDNVIQSRVAAGCNAVRVAVSRDGATIWSTARGDNLIHAYDAKRLIADPENAYLYSLPSNGSAPVGVAAFGDDKFLAVTNSNRFDAVGEDGTSVKPNIAIFDVSDRGGARFLQTIESGEFPRDIYVNADGKSVFAINWTSGTFQQISVRYTETKTPQR